MQEFKEFDDKFSIENIEHIALAIPQDLAEDIPILNLTGQVISTLCSLEDDVEKIEYHYFKKIKNILDNNDELKMNMNLGEYEKLFNYLMLKYGVLYSKSDLEAIDDYHLDLTDEE